MFLRAIHMIEKVPRHPVVGGDFFLFSLPDQAVGLNGCPTPPAWRG